MLTAYANEISDEYLLYHEQERTSDIQLLPAINYLLMAIWMVICLIGFLVIFIGKLPVAGVLIIAIPTFFGMVIKPSFALCLFALILPTSGGVGLESVFTIGRGVGTALAVAFALNLLITRPSLHVRNRALWIMLLWLIWVFLASLASPYPRLELGIFLTYFQLFILILVTYWILETNREKAFVWVLRSYVIGMLGTIIITFITGAAIRSMSDISEQERYGATLGRMIDQNLMAAVIALAFLTAVYLFVRDKSVLWRVIYIIAIGFLPIMMFRTGSRSGLLALAFTLLSPLLFLRQIWQRPKLAVLMLFVIIIASVASAFIIQTGTLPERIVQRLTSVEEAKTAYAYRMGLNMVAVRVGLSRLFGSGGIAWFEISGARHYPHNDFFRAFGYYGVVGAALFAAIIGMMILTVRHIPLSIEKLYARAILTLIIIMGLAMGQLTEKYLWLFWAVIMAAERMSWLSRDDSQMLSEKLPT